MLSRCQANESLQKPPIKQPPRNPLPIAPCSPSTAARSPARSIPFNPKPSRGDAAITSKRWDARSPRASQPGAPGMHSSISPSSRKHQLPPRTGQNDAGELLADLLLAQPCSAAKSLRAQTIIGGLKENKMKAMRQNVELHLSVLATGAPRGR